MTKIDERIGGRDESKGDSTTWGGNGQESRKGDIQKCTYTVERTGQSRECTFLM